MDGDNYLPTLCLNTKLKQLRTMTLFVNDPKYVSLVDNFCCEMSIAVKIPRVPCCPAQPVPVRSSPNEQRFHLIKKVTAYIFRQSQLL